MALVAGSAAGAGDHGKAGPETGASAVDDARKSGRAELADGEEAAAVAGQVRQPGSASGSIRRLAKLFPIRAGGRGEKAASRLWWVATRARVFWRGLLRRRLLGSLGRVSRRVRESCGSGHQKYHYGERRAVWCDDGHDAFPFGVGAFIGNSRRCAIRWRMKSGLISCALPSWRMTRKRRRPR
jgi:hypothetical protein